MFDVTKATFKLTGQKFFTSKQVKAFEKFPLYSQDGVVDAKVIAKFFIGRYTWYVTECNLQEGIMFGLTVTGSDRPELGYISAQELCELIVKQPIMMNSKRYTFPIGVERDEHFEPKYFSEIDEEVVQSWFEHWKSIQ